MEIVQTKPLQDICVSEQHSSVLLLNESTFFLKLINTH